MLERSNAIFKNRRPRHRAIERYANVMKLGKWGLSNDVICITKDGKVINGQNRLQAVIDSGVSIHALVMLDADESMFWYMDTGQGRTLKDFLDTMGLELPSNVSSSAAYILQMLNNGKLFTRLKECQSTYGQQENVYALVEKHLDLFIAAAEYQKRMQRFSLIPSKACIVCHVICSYADYEKAKIFYETLYSKEWGSSRLFITLFNKLQSIPRSSSEGRNVDFMKVIFAAWNLFCKNKSPQKIMTSADNTLPDIYGFNQTTFIGDIEC